MQKNKKNTLVWPLVLVVLLLLNFAAAKWHARVDLTNENRFTLSSPVKNMLKNLKRLRVINYNLNLFHQKN